VFYCLVSASQGTGNTYSYRVIGDSLLDLLVSICDRVYQAENAFIFVWLRPRKTGLPIQHV